MPLAQITSGRPCLQHESQRLRDAAQRLRRARRAARRLPAPRCRRSAVGSTRRREPHARQAAPVLALGPHGVDVRRRRAPRAARAGPARAAALASAVPQAPAPTTAMAIEGAHAEAPSSASGQRARGASRQLVDEAERAAARRPPRRSSRHCRCTAPSGGATSCRPASAAKRAAARAGSPGWRRRRPPPPARSACRDCSRKARSASARAVDHDVDHGAPGSEAQRSATSVCGQRRDALRLEPHGGLQPGEREVRRWRGPASAAASAKRSGSPRSRLASPPAGRPDRAGPAAWRPCRRPRRWRRRWWCRAARSRRRPRTARSCVWPPETSSSR